MLLQQFQSGQPLTEGQKQELAGLLNQYGYELQSMYGYTPQQAADAIQSLVAGKAFVASTGDIKAYYEALSYLKGYSVQSGQPDRVTENYDRRGNKQLGKVYEFDMINLQGKPETIKIRDDAKGHFFGDNNSQNRGPHFNDVEGNHYDY